jgi:hypothetical protein
MTLPPLLVLMFHQSLLVRRIETVFIVDKHVDVNDLTEPSFAGYIVVILPFAFVLATLANLLPWELTNVLVETGVVPV